MRPPTRLEAAVALSLLALGLLALPQPFHGDQALFAISAQQWHAGGTLYVDLWDLKPPGVHAFYRLAGALFGFTEIGIHLAELLWQGALGLAIYRATGGWYRRPLARLAAPALSVGAYFAIAGTWGLTQVEGLVQLPLFLTLWASLERRWVAAGIAGAVCGLFKTPLLLIVGLLWLVGLARARPGWRAVARLGAAALAPVALVALWAWSAGLAATLAWTLFDYPLRAARTWSGDLTQLKVGLIWFARRFVGVGALAAWALLRRPRDGWLLGLGVWAVAGLAVIGLQTLSWWNYHYLLLVTPLGLLAARALDAWPRRWALPAVALVLLPALWPAAQRARRLLTADGVADYQARTYEGYAVARAEVAHLTRPGPIYVYGNPLYLYLSGRPQAGPINGWSFDILLPEQWAQLQAELTRRRPAYVFVEASQWPLIRARHPATEAMLHRAFRPWRASPAGTWFVPR